MYEYTSITDTQIKVQTFLAPPEGPLMPFPSQ